MITKTNKLNDNNILPLTWQEDHIMLIHIEENDPVFPQSYRPMSLLNVDYNIFNHG